MFGFPPTCFMGYGHLKRFHVSWILVAQRPGPGAGIVPHTQLSDNSESSFGRSYHLHSIVHQASPNPFTNICNHYQVKTSLKILD